MICRKSKASGVKAFAKTVKFVGLQSTKLVNPDKALAHIEKEESF